MSFEWKVVEVPQEGLSIPFDWMDLAKGGRSLGRAEFQLCIRYFRGKPKELWVYPKQQRGMDTYWHLVGLDSHFLTINSYEGLSAPEIWMVGWCTEHKTQSLTLYVPPESRFLHISFNGLRFLRRKWGT
jgi:hypothetical protein